MTNILHVADSIVLRGSELLVAAVLLQEVLVHLLAHAIVFQMHFHVAPDVVPRNFPHLVFCIFNFEICQSQGNPLDSHFNYNDSICESPKDPPELFTPNVIHE